MIDLAIGDPIGDDSWRDRSAGWLDGRSAGRRVGRMVDRASDGWSNGSVEGRTVLPFDERSTDGQDGQPTVNGQSRAVKGSNGGQWPLRRVNRRSMAGDRKPVSRSVVKRPRLQCGLNDLPLRANMDRPDILGGRPSHCCNGAFCIWRKTSPSSSCRCIKGRRYCPSV